jgi:hypothetical protein
MKNARNNIKKGYTSYTRGHIAQFIRHGVQETFKDDSLPEKYLDDSFINIIMKILFGESFMKVRWVSLAILLTFAFESCNPLPATAENTHVIPSVEPQETPSKIPPSTSLPELSTQEGEPQLNPSLPIPARTDPKLLIEKAREDLALRLSISETLINLVEIDEVLWSDASLGCPQAGKTYEQTQTLGYLVKLGYAGNEYEYNANIHGIYFYCKNPTHPISATPIDINP